MTAIKATVRSGRIELDEPIDLPDGTELLIPMPNGALTATDDDGPMSANEIARVLAALDRIVPFERSEQEEARLEADRLTQKEWEKAHFNAHADQLRGMWE